MAANGKLTYQWCVTMENENGKDRRTYTIPAPSPNKAQAWARTRLENEGKSPKRWHMIGLQRL